MTLQSYDKNKSPSPSYEDYKSSTVGILVDSIRYTVLPPTIQVQIFDGDQNFVGVNVMNGYSVSFGLVPNAPIITDGTTSFYVTGLQIGTDGNIVGVHGCRGDHDLDRVFHAKWVEKYNPQIDPQESTCDIHFIDSGEEKSL